MKPLTDIYKTSLKRVRHRLMLYRSKDIDSDVMKKAGPPENSYMEIVERLLPEPGKKTIEKLTADFREFFDSE